MDSESQTNIDNTKPNKKSVLNKIVETTKVHSWGETTHKLIAIWGPGVVIAFILGALAPLVLVYFGLLPDSLVSTHYFATEIKAGPKPKQIEIAEIETVPDWLQPYTSWLEKEGDSLRETDGKDYAICTLGSKAMPAAGEFVWLVKSSPGYELNGFAFRVTKDGLFERLESAKDDGMSIRFNVQGCAEGDKLLTILKLSADKGRTPSSCRDVFLSLVK